MKTKLCSIFLFTITLCAFSQKLNQPDGFSAYYGQLFQPAPNLKPLTPGRNGPRKGLDSVRRWNQIAIDASGLDHTPVAPGETRVFGEQLGPCRAARAMAIVHIAIFDSIDAVLGKYTSYTGVRAGPGPISMQAAVSEAAHDTLVALFPSQSPTFDSLLAEDLAEVKSKNQKTNGVALGQQVAAAILLLRANDGSDYVEPKMGTEWITSDLAGHWRQDPISLIPIALGAHWNEVAPFIMTSPSQFRCPPPPAITSSNYTIAYNEVKSLGGDGITTPTVRTPEQTHIGIFWAYDGTPSLCAPPRLYNQLTVQVANQMKLDEIEVARVLALVNVAMADAAIAVWESKYYFDYWRPITGIRESDPGTGPTGSGDGNPNTAGDPGFMPLGAPASNLVGPNFTPPFPAYPSGHAGFGGAVFEIFRRYYGTDNVAFKFISDEFNGVTLDNQGNVRPLLPRSFTSFSQAEEENGQSRIYLGIHWAFDKTGGIAQGRLVGDYVFDHAFLPVKSNGNHK